MNVTVCLIRVFPGYFLLPVLRQVVCWTEGFCIPGFFVDLPLENRYLKLFVMPDTLTGYLALILGGFPSIGLYSGVNGFSLVRGCDGRHYRLRNCYILG